MYQQIPTANANANALRGKIASDLFQAQRLTAESENEVLNFLLGLRRAADSAGTIREASLRIADVNYEPALVVRIGPRLESIFVLSIAQGAVTAIRIVRNPDKLSRIDRHLAPTH